MKKSSKTTTSRSKAVSTGKLRERRQNQLRVKNELQCVALVVIDDYLLDDFVGKLKFD